MITIETMTLCNGYQTNGGGAINFALNNITLRISGSIIKDNSVTDSYGGAINSNTLGNKVIAEGCLFLNNNAVKSSGVTAGGAIYLPGASSDADSGVLIARNCVFMKNSAVNYGAVGAGNVYMDNCVFASNEAKDQIGGVFVEIGGKIENSIFYNNIAGGVPDGGSSGGLAHYWSDSETLTLEVINCTFASNEARNGSAVGDSGGMYGNADNTIVKNCIFWGNIAQTNPQMRNGINNVTYCDVQDGYPGTGNASAEPRFAGAIPFSSPADLKLTSGSPTSVTQGGTTAGAPTTDFDGTARIAPYSMGAYEKN
jgi:hypothetical protein